MASSRKLKLLMRRVVPAPNSTQTMSGLSLQAQARNRAHPRIGSPGPHGHPLKGTRKRALDLQQVIDCNSYVESAMQVQLPLEEVLTVKTTWTLQRIHLNVAITAMHTAARRLSGVQTGRSNLLNFCFFSLVEKFPPLDFGRKPSFFAELRNRSFGKFEKPVPQRLQVKSW